MASLVETAIADSAQPEDVAKAAVQDAVASATPVEKENLAKELYKEATGRFPQESGDRRSVYVGGFVLVGLIFVTTIVLVMVLSLNDKAVPDWVAALATATGSGIIGGLFGFAQQS